MRHLFTLVTTILVLVISTPASAVAATADTTVEAGAQPDAVQAAARPSGRSVVVSSKADTGTGSLRHALEDQRFADAITFDPDVFPPDRPVRIKVRSELPHLSAGGMTIDASDNWVVLDGSKSTGGWDSGLMVVSDGNVIQGLQVSGFSGAAIAVGAADGNLIGGHRTQGAGPFGQGNMTTRNDVGIGLWGDGTSTASHNTVSGNLIGTDPDGAKGLGNRTGMWIDAGAQGNVVGPGNIIARNQQAGVEVSGDTAIGNSITRNRIKDNGGPAIRLGRGGHPGVVAPTILSFDLAAGTVTGATCPGCTVEVYSDRGEEATLFEAGAVADDDGRFELQHAGALRGPHLTATATHPDRGTSQLSLRTSGPRGRRAMQRGNDGAISQLQPRPSRELEDNRMGAQFDGFSPEEGYDFEIYPRGVKHARVAITGMEPETVYDWDRSEFAIQRGQEAVIDRLIENGLTVTYVLMFWDKETWPGARGAPCERFRTKGEIKRYLEFVRFTVEHFKDRIDHYEIWNEPDIIGYCPKVIRVDDYARLVKRVAPVIRKLHPDAKIVVGGVSNLRFPEARRWLFDLLETDVMPLVDVVAWHPMYGTSPAYKLYRDYYRSYPATVRKIKARAEANGFEGAYQADEIGWATRETRIADQPWFYDQTVAQKYYGRGILMHLGMDVGVGVPDDYPVIRSLATVMAGVEPADLPVRIRSKAGNVASYTFATPDGGHLIALWTDGVAVEHDPGVRATVRMSGLEAATVTGIDVLHGYEQPLVAQVEGEDLVLRDLLLRDHPLLIRLSDVASTGG
jgi:hypothetical protein